MFFDWLSIEQDFGYQLPILADVAYQRIHLESGEASALSQPTFQHSAIPFLFQFAALSLK
jgi:hypothetical protein